MLTLKERLVTKTTVVGCGHTVAKGSKAYLLTMVVCEAEAPCMYLAIRACFQALQKPRAGEWRPPFLYKLWHASVGKLVKTKQSA